MKDQSNFKLWQQAKQKGITRRRFLKLLSLGGTAAVILACKKMEMAEKATYPCIIIGAGPVGVAAAIQLAKKGISVLIVEAGHSIVHPEGSHFRNQAKFQENPDSFFEAIAPFLKPTIPGNQQLPGLADSRLMGGQGVLWTNNCPRAAAFEQWSTLSAEAWNDQYILAEQMLGVQTAVNTDAQTSKNVQQALQQGLAEENRSIQALPFSGRRLTDNKLYFNAPWDMLAELPLEVRNRIAIRSNTLVQNIVHENGQVKGVTITDGNGLTGYLATDALILAGGAIGTPKLLYRSNIRPEMLGRGFSFHALLFGQIVLDPALSARGIDATPRLWIPPTPAKPWHIQVLRDTFPVPTTESVDNPNRLLEFQAFLPINYQEANQFTFKEDGSLAVQFNFSESDHSQMQAVEKDIQELASQLGHWRGGGGAPAWVPHGTAHLVGTCRMDLSNWKGVADANGQVHDFDNLYIASVGLIPSRVAVNPTLTAVALALKTADYIADKI